MYDPYTDDWKQEVGMATASLLRKVTLMVPFIAAVYAGGLLVNMVLSGPVEFTCKSTPVQKQVKRRAEVMRLLPSENPMKSDAPSVRELMKPEYEKE